MIEKIIEYCKKEINRLEEEAQKIIAIDPELKSISLTNQGQMLGKISALEELLDFIKEQAE